ncbi:hypothetical protein OH77DRAFT_1510420 [Trametes cingulata]|nr:hypothetical protein OH77DRAFT_1510420 [Trametes cingulata]
MAVLPLVLYLINTYQGFGKDAWLLSAGSLMALIADTLVTTVLIRALRKSRTGSKRTDSMIDILIIYSVNTGLITGVIDLLHTVFAFVRPDDLIYGAFGIIGTKMYANALLAALNSRQSLAAHAYATTVDTSPFGVSVYQPAHTLVFNHDVVTTLEATDSVAGTRSECTREEHAAKSWAGVRSTEQAVYAVEQAAQKA